MTSFRVTSSKDVKVAKKAWVWLGVQRCKTLDVAPVSYELDAHGFTFENFPIRLRAEYTVGPNINNSNKLELDDDHPLLHHVGVVAAGMTAEQIFVKGAGSFVNQVQERVQMDLGGKFGIQVYHANVKMIQIGVPANVYLAQQKKKVEGAFSARTPSWPITTHGRCVFNGIMGSWAHGR
ncbi:hypothetical protein QOZ80_1AG0003930 [Eleusine coracana subsp. coracana]|nr:hypothetical protein QOZ80_1AG0003930 [Eleusine coracana subsp. coracana]